MVEPSVVKRLLRDPDVRTRLMSHGIPLDTQLVDEAFHSCQWDMNGMVSVEDFAIGLLKAANTSDRTHTRKMAKDAKKLTENTMIIQEKLVGIEEQLGIIYLRLTSEQSAMVQPTRWM